jgi:hypothetical protein
MTDRKVKPAMRADIEVMRAQERSALLPKDQVTGVRFNRVQNHQIQAKAAALEVAPSELLRLLIEKGAQHYGFSLND